MPDPADTCTYDALGRLVTKKHRRLVGVLDGESAAIEARRVKGRHSITTTRTYALARSYDALGRRIIRDQSNNQEILLWWGKTKQSEHKHQAGQVTIQNDLQANPSEQAFNTIFGRALEGNKQDIQYFHKNYLDHVMGVSNDNGNLIEHYRYTAFGEPEMYNNLGQKLAASAINNDILWNVRRYEADTGLYMYLYRHYDAASGRWPSRDPIEEKGGVNLYRFASNRALDYLDLLGLADGQVTSWKYRDTAVLTHLNSDFIGIYMTLRSRWVSVGAKISDCGGGTLDYTTGISKTNSRSYTSSYGTTVGGSIGVSSTTLSANASSSLGVTMSSSNTFSSSATKSKDYEECECIKQEAWIREYRVTLEGYDDDILFNDSFGETVVSQWFTNDLKWTFDTEECDSATASCGLKDHTDSSDFPTD